MSSPSFEKHSGDDIDNTASPMSSSGINKAAKNARNSSGFVGLLNQMATCYLNSLVQHLFMTPEFRKGIYSLTEQELGLTGVEGTEEEVMEEYTSPLLHELTGMGFARGISKKALQETIQSGKECLQRAIEWILPRLDQEFEEEPILRPKQKSKQRKIIIQLQILFALLQEVNKKAVATKMLTESFGWKSNESAQQHDVHELNRILFEAIESSLRNTPAQNLITKLYAGKLVNKVKCTACGFISERLEDFQDVTTVVKGHTSLIYSLEHLVQPQQLEKENQYFCEHCNVKQDATYWVCFRELPSILIFSLARFEYDFLTGNRKKNSDPFHYPLSLDMEPFTENVEPHQPSKQIAARKLSLYEPAMPHDSSLHQYDLSSVIIHTGSSGNHGHYHAYIKDGMEEGNWKYKPKTTNVTSGTLSELKKHKRSSSGDTTIPIGEDLTNLNKENFSSENLPPAAPSLLPTVCNPLRIPDIPLFIAPKETEHPEDLDQTSGWFDFNDSSVSPITVKDLRSQFGGKTECAYMLVYRKQELSSFAHAPPSIPHFLRPMIDKKNTDIHIKHIEKEKEANRIDLHIFLSSAFCQDSLGIARLLPVSLQSPPNRMTITIDKRYTVGQLLDSISLSYDPSLTLLHPIRILQEKLIISYPKHGIRKDCGTLAEQVGLQNGAKLLLWDGSTIQGLPWNPFRQIITIQLSFITEVNKEANYINLAEKECSGVDPTSYLPSRLSIHTSSLDITWETSLQTLYELICRSNNIEVDHCTLFLLRTSTHSTVLLHKTLPNPFLDTTSTFQFQDLVADQETIHISVLSTKMEKEAKIRLLHRFLEERNHTVTLEVLNKMKKKGLEATRLVVNAPKEESLYNVKKGILDSLHLTEMMDHVRFRRIGPSGIPRTMYQNEFMKVEEMEAFTIILETGDSPSSEIITIKCKLSSQLAGSKEAGEKKLQIRKSWKIARLLQEMKKCLSCTEEGKFLIKRSDLWGNMTTTISCEMNSVEGAKLKSGNLYILYKPSTAPKLFLSLLLYEYLDKEYSSTIPSSFCSSGIENTKEEKEEKEEEEKEEFSIPEDGEEDWILYSPAQYSGSFIPSSYVVTNLGGFPISKEATLLECKENVLRVVALLAAVSSPYHIRMWHKERILKGHHHIFNSLYSSSSPLLIQVLEHAEDLPADVASLVVFKRNCVDRKFHRPLEYLYKNGGVHLFDCIAADFHIPPSYLELFLFSSRSRIWRSVYHDTLLVPYGGYSEAHVDLGELFSGSAESSLPHAEQAVMDGDIVVIKDLRTDKHNSDPLDADGFANFQYTGRTSTSKKVQSSWEPSLRIHVDNFDSPSAAGKAALRRST